MVKIDSAVGNLAVSARAGALEDYASGGYYCERSPKCGLPTISLYTVIVYEPQEQGSQRARRSRCFANSTYCRYLLNFLLAYVVSRHHCQGEIIFTVFFQIIMQVAISLLVIYSLVRLFRTTQDSTGANQFLNSLV